MELNECSANSDSGGEEDEEDDMSDNSGSISSSNSSGGSSSSDSGDDSGDENGTTGSSSESSVEDEDEDDVNSRNNDVKKESDSLRWETCSAAGVKVKLPQDLCEHASIFKALMNYPKVWQESLTSIQRESLMGLLPKFPKDCDVNAELDKTLQMLFRGENHRFGVSAVDSFHSHLSAGHYRPDIKRMRKLVRKAQQKRYIFEERKRSYELANDLLKSRESLLSNAYKQGFSQPTHRTASKLHWRKPKPALVDEKTHLRYMEELNALHSELGADMRLGADTTSENEENYPQHQLMNLKQKKRKRQFAGMQNPLLKGLQLDPEDNAVRPVFSTLQRIDSAVNLSLQCRELNDDTYRAMLVAHKRRKLQRDNHPELNTQGISLSDLTHRAQIGQKHKILPPPVARVNPKKRIKLEQPNSVIPSPVLPKMSVPYVKKENDPIDFGRLFDDNKHHKEQKSFVNLSSVKNEPVDIYEHHHNPVKVKISTPYKGGKPAIMIPPPDIKEEIEVMETEIKQENIVRIEELSPKIEEPVHHIKKELDLDSIDMMQIPIQLDDGIDILDEVKCEDENVISISEKEVLAVTADDFMSNGDLMQETHASFFSLLRDAFMSKGEYRMNATEMRDAVTQWQGNPISPLNDWYAMATSWPALVPLALGFLAGELTYPKEHEPDSEQEFVPYLENKGCGVYAWIGAGRDSDSRLSMICSQFLSHKDSLAPAQMLVSTPAPSKHQPSQQVNQKIILEPANVCNNVTISNNSSPATEAVSIAPDNAAAAAEWEPPRALCPTDWKVRPSTAEEREEFRRQERMRYAAPHKAFTYRMHGYSSVVGPVKGIYQHNIGSGLTKARGHSLLVPDRPNFVTILALVRDATARLPNGEGTRADICQLLKDSQYIKELEENDNDKEGNLHSVVSGALDRLHYEADPCVRYYPKRKEWLYLHRARSESEFEMYHQQLQGVPKNKKSTGSASRNKNLQSANKPTANKDQQNLTGTNKEATPKKEKKVAVQTPPVISRKEQWKAEEKIVSEIVSPAVTVEQSQVSPTIVTNVSTISTCPPPICSTGLANSVTSAIASIETSSPALQQPEIKTHVSTSPTLKKLTNNINMKPVAVVKTSVAQSLLQSNQSHFPPHQIQVSTSSGLQTIRLSGHSVLHSAQPASSSATNMATIFTTTKSQSPQTQTQSLIANQVGKSILQSVNIKQPQQQQSSQAQAQQHVLPGKTLLASQIKLVSSGQIKSLLSGHGLQSQTIFIKQTSPSAAQGQQIQQQAQQQQQIKQQQPQTRVITTQQQQQQIQAPGMQRIIAQIGGKPIAVQIQQSPRNQQNQQQQILAKVLTNANTGQLISVENLIGQKGLKIATAANPNQINRQGKQVIQAQYQVVSQGQSSSGNQPKIIVTSQAQQQQTQQSQDQSQTSVAQGQQTVRMVTAQLAGKPIVLASGNKGVSMGVNANTGVVLGKQGPAQGQQLQQPIILPSQLLNIKTLHGLKVIPTPAGLKTTGAAVYARVIAPTTLASVQTTQTTQAQTQRNNTFGNP